MTSEKIFLGDLHFENQLWTRQLNFYKEEIGMFEEYLGKVAVSQSPSEVGAQVEHFQNQFIREKEVIDTLTHDIKVEEQRLAKEAADQLVSISPVEFENHQSLRDQMTQFEKIYHELKIEFRRFLSQWV
jgi:hypothetical protein